MKTKMLLTILGLFIVCTCILSAQDDDNPVILQEKIIYEDGNAIVQQRDVYTYNEDNLLIEEAFYYRERIDDGNGNEIYSLEPNSTKKYTYLSNSDKILKTIKYNYFPTSEELTTVITTLDYTYYDNGCLKTLEKKHIDNDNVNPIHTSYYNSSCSENSTYIDNPFVGQIEKDSTLFYTGCGEDTKIFKKVIYEHEEFKETTLTYDLYNGIYQLSDTDIREFDAFGNKIYSLSTQTDSDNLRETFYIYDEDNNLIQSDYYAKENIDSTKEHYNRKTYDFNEFGHLIHWKTYRQDADSDNIIPDDEAEYTYIYDETGNIVEQQENLRSFNNIGLPTDWRSYTTVYDVYCDGLSKEDKWYTSDNKLKRATKYYYLKGTDCDDENLPPLSLTAYPNPATDYITLGSDVLLQENSTVSLYDVTGKLIWQKNLAQRLDRYTLSTQSLPKGMYLVRVISGEDVFSQKFFRE